MLIQHIFFAKKEAYLYKRDWLFGAIKGIEYKLTAERKANQSEQLNALIIYNDKALNRFIQIKHPVIKTSKVNPYSQSAKFNQAYVDGYNTGKQFNVNKPLDNLKPQKQIS